MRKEGKFLKDMTILVINTWPGPQWYHHLHNRIIRMVPTAGHLLPQTVSRPNPVPLLSTLVQEDHSLAVVSVRSPLPLKEVGLTFQIWPLPFALRAREGHLSLFLVVTMQTKAASLKGNRAFRPGLPQSTCLSWTKSQTPAIVLLNEQGYWLFFGSCTLLKQH